DASLQTSLASRGARRSRQIRAQTIEDTVDERAGLARREFFRDVHRFVDADHGRDVVTIEHFEHGETENIAVDGGDAWQLPMLRVLLDLLVHFVAMENGAADQFLRK